MQVHLLPAGRERLQLPQRVGREATDSFFSPISQAEWATLHSILARLAGRAVTAPALAAVAALVLGFIPAGLTFGLRRNAAQEIGLSELPVPAWVFIGIWAIIYQSMGIAAWQIAASRDTTVSTIVLAAGFLQSIAFWFTDSLRSTPVMDATGVLLSITATAVLALTTPSAAPWLLPWLVWMPATLRIKLVALRRANKHVVRAR